MSMKERVTTLSKNQRAMAGFIRVVAFAVIAGVVIYCDIQFIQVMWKTYPNGIAKIFSLIGAVATGASVMALIGAEAFWFSRGPQMVFGWLFTAIEVIIMACNVILGFELSGGIAKLDPFMGAYLWLCPATPVIAAICWIMIFNLDEEQKARHDEREMQDDLAEAERNHTKAVHKSKMQLKGRYLESSETYLDQIADDPNIQAGLQMGAWKFAAEELRNLTGMYFPLPTQPSAPVQQQIVDGFLAPASTLPQATATATPAHAPEPRKQGWLHNPFARTELPPTQAVPTLAEIVAAVTAALQQSTPVPAQSEKPVLEQTAPERMYPILPAAPRYIDTVPLARSLIDDLVESVEGESANPLAQKASQNGSR